jgi:hypothetical protein
LEKIVDCIITDESMHKSARKIPIHMRNKAVTGKGAEVEKECFRDRKYVGFGLTTERLWTSID